MPFRPAGPFWYNHERVFLGKTCGENQEGAGDDGFMTEEKKTAAAADAAESAAAAGQTGESAASAIRINARLLVNRIAEETGLAASRVKAAVELLEAGNSIPFIARYRKEMTGELDENQLRLIEERLHYLRNLEIRKQEVLRLIGEQGKLTPELEAAVRAAVKLQEVEDLYRPFRPKRKTRAGIARERGLKPLADWIMAQPAAGSPLEEASRYVDAEKGVATAEEALQGALDIIAENVADDAGVRAWTRKFVTDHGIIVTEAKDRAQQTVYEMYYEYCEPVRKIPPHRVLAINRGEREDVLKVAVEAEMERIESEIARRFVKGPSAVKELLEAAIADACRRLLFPSIEREVRAALTEKAEEQAIKIFAGNLRNLLLQPPVKGKTVLGIDPAYRTGCKLAVVDETGKLLDVDVIHPTPPHNKTAEAAAVVRRLIDRHRVDLIAIGNGTASRETELFVAGLLKEMPERGLQYIIVSEAGASVYSASKLAAEEFPDLDVAERSAVSIARRLQDPLAELVKIDPKSIGVGQYQHDVSQKRLEESLRFVVESAVNHVGVDVNTASPSLLSYVSGINAAIAKNIVKYREQIGKFTNRSQLKDVPRLGAKTYEQCIGFLRIPGGDEPLDNTPIHPESYGAVERLFEKLGLDIGSLGKPELKEAMEALDPQRLAPELGIGVPTLRDIIEALLRPGRDPREDLPPPIFRTDVLKIEDLKPGMELVGTVRNVIDFGAFVDIGVKNDGLVHISQMSDRYVRHPMDVVSVGDIVKVWVLSADPARGRVSLTMRKPV